MFLALAICTFLYLFYKWGTANNNYFKYKGVTHAKPVFLVGSKNNIFLQKKSVLDVVHTLYHQFGDEKIYGYFEFLKPVFFIRDPKIVKQIAIKDFDNFTDRRAFFDEDADKLFGRGLPNLRGQKWRDMRSTLSPMFTGSKMRMMYNFVADVGNQTAKTMSDEIKSGSDNVFEFKALASKFTVDVIASCAFGIEVNSFKQPDNAFAKMAAIATDLGNWKIMLKFFGYMAFKPIMKILKIRLFGVEIENFFIGAVKDTMEVREEKGIVRNDMINLLMQAKKGSLSHEIKDPEKVTEGFATVEELQLGKAQMKRVWDDNDLAAQAFIFFFAGFESIATTMSFMAYEITVNPHVQKKLFDEIEEMERELNGKTISYDKIQGMKYLDQVVCETLRKWPVGAMADRICVKDFELDVDGKKITIEKDRTLIIPVWGFHSDPNYFPDPRKFDPERFSDENRGKIDPDTYLPFGIGPRNCIGSRFALMELKTIFYYLLLNFSFEACEKTQIPLQLAKNPLGLKTENGIWMALKPRN